MQMRIEPLNRIIALGFFMSPVLIFTDRKADLCSAMHNYNTRVTVKSFFEKLRSVRK
jgi:hypothetical protein